MGVEHSGVKRVADEKLRTRSRWCEGGMRVDSAGLPAKAQVWAKCGGRVCAANSSGNADPNKTHPTVAGRQTQRQQ